MDRDSPMEQQVATKPCHLGERLRARREAMGLTQDQLAKKLGTSAAEIRMFEDGAKRIPPRRLVQAAETLGPSLQWFLEGSPAASCEAALGPVSRDVARFLAMPDAYPLISAFIAISSRERRQSLILQAQAASHPEGSAGAHSIAPYRRKQRF